MVHTVALTPSVGSITPPTKLQLFHADFGASRALHHTQVIPIGTASPPLTSNTFLTLSIPTRILIASSSGSWCGRGSPTRSPRSFRSTLLPRPYHLPSHFPHISDPPIHTHSFFIRILVWLGHSIRPCPPLPLPQHLHSHFIHTRPFLHTHSFFIRILGGRGSTPHPGHPSGTVHTSPTPPTFFPHTHSSFIRIQVQPR